MGSMKGKQEKIDAAFGRIADMIPSGNLLASADPVGFLDTVAAELKDLRAENVKLKGTVSIKQDRVNDLELVIKASDKEKSMEVHELIRIVHLADAIEVICDETGMTIPDCLNRLKGIDGLRTDECEQIKLYHTHEMDFLFK